jgi:hypothetical protein
MSNVEFNDQFHVARSAGPRNKMATWLVAKGIGKDERQASIILVLIILVIIGLSVFILLTMGPDRGTLPAGLISDEIPPDSF